jgi:short-subunit dehydrogenase
MNLADARVLVTGASGGIGAATVRELVNCGAEVLMTGRDEAALNRIAREADPERDLVGVFTADVRRADDRRALAEAARTWRGGVNVLINNAGVAAAALFVDVHAEDIEHAFAVNALAPMQLCRTLLPHLLRQPDAHIVNVGSVFGAIGYPGHAVYSATKFALRGFSEALRRELADTRVRVHYLAPRATRTKFNDGAVDALNAELGVATDAPERVAASVRALLERECAERVVGWPENLYVRINAVLPRLVDRSLRAQLPAIQRCLAAWREPGPAAVQSLPRKAS